MAAVLGASSSMLNSGQIFLFYLWRRWFSRVGSGISYSFLVSLTATQNQGSWLRRKPSGVSWWLLLVVKLRTILLRDAPKAKDGRGCSWLSQKPGVSGANTAGEGTCQTLPSLCGCELSPTFIKFCHNLQVALGAFWIPGPVFETSDTLNKINGL